MFPWLFRKNNLGPLIGTRTWGGLVGINGFTPLADGGGVTAPAFGIYDAQETKFVAENTGIDPDITVDWTPEDWKAGRDPQLDKTIQYLMDELKKHPQPELGNPQFPKVNP
jgi:tricorn protease